MSHPAYPSAADLRREAAAADRDVADLVALRLLRQIVETAIARAGLLDDLRHPDRRWSRDIPIAITAIPGASPCTI